jgi:dTDP-glucose 4,6-dehydratase
MENLHIVGLLCEVLDELQTRADGRSYGTQVKHVEDRRAHDRRYAIDARKIREELGWAPAVSFDVGLRRTVEWYLANEPWWSAIREGTYRGERLGVVA